MPKPPPPIVISPGTTSFRLDDEHADMLSDLVTELQRRGETPTKTHALNRAISLAWLAMIHDFPREQREEQRHADAGGKDARTSR